MRITLAVLTLALAALASPSSAELPEVPVETHCVADDTGAAHCSTTVAGTCTVTSVAGTPTSASCDLPVAMALPVSATCSLGPMTPGGDTDCRATAAGCSAHVHHYDVEDALDRHEADCGCVGYDNYGRPALRIDCSTPPPIASTSAAALAPPTLPCYTGIAGSWCTVAAYDCKATVGHQTGGQAYQYAGAYCGPHMWYPCTIAYVDTLGNVESCYLDATSTAAADPTQVCQTGIAQTWCDFTVGPCDLRVTPWTAWGDQYVVSDCRTGGAGPTCHTEVHTQGPLAHEHWCAF